MKPKNANATGKAALERRNTSGQGEEKKEEQQEVQQNESAQQQQRLGNAAMQSLIGQEADRGGSTDMVGRAKRPEVGQFEHGGVDDGDAAPDPGDLADVWDFLPRTTQPEDRAGFLEDMPLEELPPEDEALRALAGELAEAPPLTLSVGAFVGSVSGAARAASAFAANDQVGALLWTWLSTPPTALQAPDAEPLAARAAHFAAVHLALSWSNARHGQPATQRLAHLVAEVGARADLARRVARVPEEITEPLTSIFLANPWLDGDDDAPAAPLDADSAALWSTLAVPWLAIEDPRPLVPSLAPEARSPDPDDPLGLDGLLEAFLTPREAHDATLADAAVDSAERIAWRVWQLRLHLAGWTASFVEAAEAVSGGAPTGAIVRALTSLDVRIDEVLALLGEIARAARARTVPPAGLRNGLRRAAERTWKLQLDAITHTAGLLGAACDGDARLPPGAPLDPNLREALRDGDAEAAIAAVDALGLPPADRTAAIELTRMILNPRGIPDASHLPEPLGPVAILVELFAAWRLGDNDWALAVADTLRSVARATQDGPLLAAATIVACRVLAPHHPAVAAHLLADTVRLAGTFGSDAAISALARVPSPRPNAQIAPPAAAV